MARLRARPGGSFRSPATSAARRQARTGTRDPTTTGAHWAAANEVPARSIGMAARKLGSGSQTSKAGRGKTSGGVW